MNSRGLRPRPHGPATHRAPSRALIRAGLSQESSAGLFKRVCFGAICGAAGAVKSRWADGGCRRAAGLQRCAAAGCRGCAGTRAGGGRGPPGWVACRRPAPVPNRRPAGTPGRPPLLFTVSDDYLILLISRGWIRRHARRRTLAGRVPTCWSISPRPARTGQAQPRSGRGVHEECGVLAIAPAQGRPTCGRWPPGR